MNSSCIKHRDGKTYFTSEYVLSNAPKIKTLWWYLPGVDAPDNTPADYTDGVISYRLHGFPRRIYLGNPQAEIIEERDIPQPKVRKGISVRWNGTYERWEKLLRNGWVPA